MLCAALDAGGAPIAYAAASGCWLVRDEQGALSSGGAWDGRARIQAERALGAAIGAALAPQIAAHWWCVHPDAGEQMVQVVDDPAGLIVVHTRADVTWDTVSGILVPGAIHVVSSERCGDDHARAAERFARLRCALGVIARITAP